MQPIKSDRRIAIAVDGVPMRDEGGYYWPMTDIGAWAWEGIFRDQGHTEWADEIAAAVAEAKKQRGEDGETI